MTKFKSGQYKTNLTGSSYNYKRFMPETINKPYKWHDKDIDLLLEKASSNLSKLNTFALQMPDISFFIKMHVAKEATTSSEIEGTQTNIEEVFIEKENLVPEKRDDWEEVQNYIKAMNLAINKLKDLPLSIRLIKKAHKILLSGVRGEKKNPGQIRKTQNWIGGTNINNANFVPPHPDDLPKLLSDLEKFWHNDKLQLPYLIKTAISHYQFETIHPFLDGNGRIGRLTITLYLIDVSILDKPVLYLSHFLNQNRTKYFQLLSQVRKENNMDQWLKFFLKGVTSTSKKGINTLQKAVNLKRDYDNLINKKVSSRQKKLSKKALSYLLSDPIVTVKELSNELGITFPTANSLLDALEKLEIVKEITGKQRNRQFKLKNYIEIFS